MVLLVGLFAIFAVALDVGASWTQRRNMQNVADAAALAGAQELDGSTAGRDAAEVVALDYVSKNVSNLAAAPTITFNDGVWTEIQVIVAKESPSFFLANFGIGDHDLAAKATARKSNAQISEGIIPVAVPQENIGAHGQLITVTSGVPQSQNGPVVGNIQLPPKTPGSDCQDSGGNGNGANDLGNGIECGSAVGITLGQELDSKKGGSSGPVRTAFENRVENSTDIDGAGTDCRTLDDVFLARPDDEPWEINPVCAPGSYQTMLVFIPVIDEWDGQGSNLHGTVIDLALFWIDPDQQVKCSEGGVCQIQGMWITSFKELLLASGTGQPGGEFSIFQVIQLID